MVIQEKYEFVYDVRGQMKLKRVACYTYRETGQALSKGLLMGHVEIRCYLFQLFPRFWKSDSKMNLFLTAKNLPRRYNTVWKSLQAVMKLVEGTILTVAKDAANVGVEIKNNR